ncbi:zinc-ribbon domain-containing protein [bacterium]|nr:zinc-ribbon domain-containing protein [bacterium]
MMQKMKCRRCGHEVLADNRFCPFCGAGNPAAADWKGSGFEWKSTTTVCGYPLVHIAFGRDENGKIRVAKGVLAVGQFGIGLITVAQIGFGAFFGIGQVMVGTAAVAQVAVTALFGLGQFATGYAAIGQFALAYYGLAQFGLARHLWSTDTRDPEAARFFIEWASKLGLSIGRWFGRG